MATSPIYNWPEPDNTDLVKNGALAIRTLGDAIDTTMATMTPKSLVDAKGDLIAASAADTPARLAVGSNGETLVADSSTATGLRYQATNAAGKNLIINGGMDVWQRGTTTGTVTQAKTFLADRFYSASGAAGLSYTATQSTDKPDGFRYSLKVQRTAGNTTASEIYLWQDIETNNAIAYAGKTITVSFYAKRGANFSATSNNLGMAFRSGTGTDQTQYYASYTGQADVVTGLTSLTTSWQRFSFTGTVAANATELGFNVYYTASGTAGADDSFFITGVQVEVGSVATNFTRAGGTIQGELAACQRYYEKSYDQATTPGTATLNGIYWGSGSAASATTSFLNTALRYNVVKRNVPTVTIWDGAGTVNTCTRTTLGVGDNNGQSVTVAQNGNTGANVYTTGTSNTTFFFHYVANSEL